MPDTEFLNSNASVSTFAGCIKAHHGWVALTPRCWVILLMTREGEAVEGIPLLKFKVSALHYCAFREAKRDGSLINYP